MSERMNIGETITGIKADAERVGKDLVALGRAETKPIVKHAGIGGGAFGVAAVIGVAALFLLSCAGGFAFAIIFVKAAHWSVVPSLALGYVCMAVLFLIIAGILALVGKSQFGKVQPPRATIAEAKATLGVFKKSIERGQSVVASNEVARKQNAVTRFE